MMCQQLQHSVLNISESLASVSCNTTSVRLFHLCTRSPGSYELVIIVYLRWHAVLDGTSTHNIPLDW